MLSPERARPALIGLTLPRSSPATLTVLAARSSVVWVRASCSPALPRERRSGRAVCWRLAARKGQRPLSASSGQLRPYTDANCPLDVRATRMPATRPKQGGPLCRLSRPAGQSAAHLAQAGHDVLDLGVV